MVLFKLPSHDDLHKKSCKISRRSIPLPRVSTRLYMSSPLRRELTLEKRETHTLQRTDTVVWSPDPLGESVILDYPTDFHNLYLQKHGLSDSERERNTGLHLLLPTQYSLVPPTSTCQVSQSHRNTICEGSTSFIVLLNRVCHAINTESSQP